MGYRAERELFEHDKREWVTELESEKWNTEWDKLTGSKIPSTVVSRFVFPLRYSISFAVEGGGGKQEKMLQMPLCFAFDKTVVENEKKGSVSTSLFASCYCAFRQI